MKTYSYIMSALRRKNKKQYILLAGCCFFSVLLITTYASIMRAPTVLNVLPEGGDSRKQVMMIFVLAVIGCAMFTTYAFGLFFRNKAKETGVFLALGSSHKRLKQQMMKELTGISLLSCFGGALFGMPLAWLIWQLFKLLLVDTEEMSLRFDPQAYLYPLLFSGFVIIMMFVMLSIFIRRTNIIDIVNEARKSEPIRDVPHWYGMVGILLLIIGGLLGYLTPAFCVRVLHWYPPEGLTAFTYLPALVGLYMVLLHTVVNGWRKKRNRYKNIVGTSMMKFQGRQTVRNMLVITVLVAGAYFAAFYTPIVGSGMKSGYNNQYADYAFTYRADQNMITEKEIIALAGEMGVTVSDYRMEPVAVLGMDGVEQVEKETSLGTTYTTEYTELLSSGQFMNESSYNALTGEAVSVSPGTVAAVYDDEGNYLLAPEEGITRITNMCTGKVLAVVQEETTLNNTGLAGRYVLSGQDYQEITAGLTEEWREMQVFFNVDNPDETYRFAKKLYNEIIDRSDPEVLITNWWDPVAKLRIEERGEDYWIEDGAEFFSPEERDSSNFRLYWKYMPSFGVMDRADIVKTLSVYLMLFIFVAIICFSAVLVIAYTRSLTIGFTNAQVYRDLKHLGAADAYLYQTVREQVSKVYFAPILTGTIIISGLYSMIMFFNDGMFTSAEISGMFSCLMIIAAISLLLYGAYRYTLSKVCRMLGISGTKKK